MVATYQFNASQQEARLATVEKNQKILEKRLQLVEAELTNKQTSIEKMQNDLNRTVTYLQLLLDKNGIYYIK
jgi:multidrug resistance efflux pump